MMKRFSLKLIGDTALTLRESKRATEQPKFTLRGGEMVKNVKRGDIYYVMRNKSVGHEMRGGRPAIVVSNDTLNSKLDTVEVVR